MLAKKAQSRLVLKLKFVRNSATLDVTNISFETVIFNPKERLGILDWRSIRYYKIKHCILQQNLSKYFRFESADILCVQFNKFVNVLKKEKEETNGKYPWLDKDDERRNMSKRYWKKYIDLGKSWLSELENKEGWTCYTNIKMYFIWEIK